MSINLSYAHGTSDVPLKGETIGQHLQGMASVFPQREVLVSPYQNYRATYSEFLNQCEQAAKGNKKRRPGRNMVAEPI